MDENFDVVVVGGGAAGLSGALALVRSRRSVLVLDGGDPRNAPAGHVHNFLTRDGTPPAELYAVGRAEVESYGGVVRTARVQAIRPVGDRFEVDTEGGVVGARRVLVATGLRDDLPDVPGLRERWGVDVLHCPYCHGWEVRDQRVGVLATGPTAAHQALLFRQLTGTVTLLTHTAPALTDEQREQLDALDIAVVPGEVVAVESVDDRLTGVRLASGATVALDALVIAPVFRARAELLEPLGLQPVDVLLDGAVVATRIESGQGGATAVPGVFVAGNVTDPMAQVVTSAGAGLMAGALANADLVRADVRAAVDALRYERTHGATAWDERYRSAEGHVWSGNPNAVLVQEVSDLSPGSALDAGAGEGADALWLAERGWRVTAVDVSGVALERAAERGRQQGLDVDWRRLDLATEPVEGRYDLVTSHYLHLPPDPRRSMLDRLKAAVAPGGILLVVGHDPSDTEHAAHRPADFAERSWTAQQLADELGDGWRVEVAETRPRAVVDHDGRRVTHVDAVLLARRL